MQLCSGNVGSDRRSPGAAAHPSHAQHAGRGAWQGAAWRPAAETALFRQVAGAMATFTLRFRVADTVAAMMGGGDWVGHPIMIGTWGMLRHLVAMSWVLFATSAAAEPSALSGDAIRETFAGAIVEVDTPLGVKLPIQYFEDGRLSGEARGLAYILGAPTDTGKW